jgi:nucleotide-binding universal stress UspA family protein
MSSAHAQFQLRILIAYDGSADSRAAVDLAAVVFPGAGTVVLSVWEPFLASAMRGGWFLDPVPVTPGADTLGARAAAAIRETAGHGAERARRLGLDAEPRWVADVTNVWQAIVEAATNEAADVIVIGSRGLTGVRSALAGSVSQRVVRHAQRPVLVVPSVATTERRRGALRAGAGRSATDGASAAESPRRRSWRHPTGSVTGGMRSQVVPLQDR